MSTKKILREVNRIVSQLRHACLLLLMVNLDEKTRRTIALKTKSNRYHFTLDQDDFSQKLTDLHQYYTRLISSLVEHQGLQMSSLQGQIHQLQSQVKALQADDSKTV
jgi:hypothetical protein